MRLTGSALCRDRERQRELDSKCAAAGREPGAAGAAAGGERALGGPAAERPPEAERPVLKDTGVGTDDVEMECADGAAVSPSPPPAAAEVRRSERAPGHLAAFCLGAGRDCLV